MVLKIYISLRLDSYMKKIFKYEVQDVYIYISLRLDSYKDVSVDMDMEYFIYISLRLDSYNQTFQTTICQLVNLHFS